MDPYDVPEPGRIPTPAPAATRDPALGGLTPAPEAPATAAEPAPRGAGPTLVVAPDDLPPRPAGPTIIAPEDPFDDAGVGEPSVEDPPPTPVMDDATENRRSADDAAEIPSAGTSWLAGAEGLSSDLEGDDPDEDGWMDDEIPVRNDRTLVLGMLGVAGAILLLAVCAGLIASSGALFSASRADGDPRPPPAPAPTSAAVPSPGPAPEVVPEPEPALEVEPEPVEAEPAPAPAPQLEPAPVPKAAPAPVPKAAPPPVPKAAPRPRPGPRPGPAPRPGTATAPRPGPAPSPGPGSVWGPIPTPTPAPAPGSPWDAPR